MPLKPIAIAPHLSYLPAIEHPLSADIGIIEGTRYTWIFDAGAFQETTDYIQKLPKMRNLILSHFHQDHIRNWNQITFHELYQGSHTYKYTKTGIIIQQELQITDGVTLHLFPIPASHAKGSIGLEINETYAFLGDAIYPMQKQGKRAYNATLLQDEIHIISALKAPFLLLSHDKHFIHPKEKVLTHLREIYAMRTQNNPYIFV